MSKLSILYGIAIGVLAVTSADWRLMIWSGVSCGVCWFAVFAYSFTDYGPGPFWGRVLEIFGFGIVTSLGSLAVWTVLALCGWPGPGFPPALALPFQLLQNGVKQVLISALRFALSALE
jgi:hypothetical protein